MTRAIHCPCAAQLKSHNKLSVAFCLYLSKLYSFYSQHRDLATYRFIVVAAKMPCQPKLGQSKKSTTGRMTKLSNKKKPPKNKSQETKENRLITDYYPTVSRRVLAAQSKLEEYNNQIRKCIETQSDPIENLVVSEFENKGKGIIAANSIKKGCFICEYSGDLIEIDEAKIRENDYAMTGAGCYMYYFNWNSSIWCIDATKPTGRYGRLINHSRKSPNCKTKLFEHNDKPHLIFIALRDIEENEEILYDYGERDRHAIKYNPWLKST